MKMKIKNRLQGVTEKFTMPKPFWTANIAAVLVLVLHMDASATAYKPPFVSKGPPNSTLLSNTGLADIRITGTVLDENGQPLIGASVKVKGSALAVSTSTTGAFSITVPDNAILVVSFVGYEPQEVTAAGKTTLTVTLRPSTNTLNQVVVTALGIKREAKSLGYSTTTVGGEQLTQSREVNLGNALTGKVAGVSVANNSTGTGGSSRVVIRGNNSLTGDNQPLYVIDGVPFDRTNQGSAGQYGGIDLGDGLSNINPDDIANIQVLKGAAASALYGYRGGNGAILITTKSGTKGKGVNIELNNNLTFNSIIDYRDFQTTYGQGSQGNKPTTASAALNTGNSSWGAKLDGTTAVNLLGNEYAYSLGEDNWKNFYKTSINNQSSVAFSGAGENITYRVGLSNLYNTSNIPTNTLKQQGININTTYNITKKLQFTLTGNYIFEQVKNRALLSDASTNVNATLMYLANSFDVRWLKPGVKADGTELTPTNGLYFNNPYFLTDYHQNNSQRNRLTGAATLKYNIFDWLYLQGQVTRDGYILDFRKVTPTGTAYAPGGELTEYERNFRELNTNFLLGLDKKFNDFSITANLGGNSQDNVNKAYGLDGTASPFILPYLYTANNIANRPYSQQYQHYRVNSFYGSADFGYKDWLFLNVTGRNDWFSTLNPEHNSYFYPSVTGSFVFSEALKLPSWINFGKLRASYAASSNGTSPYQNYLTYGIRTYTTNGNSVGYINQSTIPNSDLRPVDIKEQEIGLNMQFLNNRLGFDAAVYNKQTTNDIVSVSTSNSSGYNAAIQNVGKIRNRGVEFLLTGSPIKTPDFSWNASFNIAYNKNKVLFLGDGIKSLNVEGAVANRGDGVAILNVVGMPYSEIVGYAYQRDASGNKVFGADGQPLRTSTIVPLGSGIYKTTGGFNNEFRYKSFNLSFLFDFKYGAKIYSGTNLALYADGLQKTTLQGREGGYVGQGVTESGAANTTSVNAQTYFTNLTGSNNIAEEFVYDASFIKLRQLVIGYNLPTSWVSKLSIKSANLSLVTRNLATLMKHTPNIDPESNYSTSNGQGLEANGYPPTRSIGLNLNVKF
jgi:TonB-linked SusC/RagA family outer membrane protein